MDDQKKLEKLDKAIEELSKNTDRKSFTRKVYFEHIKQKLQEKIELEK